MAAVCVCVLFCFYWNLAKFFSNITDCRDVGFVDSLSRLGYYCSASQGHSCSGYQNVFAPICMPCCYSPYDAVNYRITDVTPYVSPSGADLRMEEEKQQLEQGVKEKETITAEVQSEAQRVSRQLRDREDQWDDERRRLQRRLTELEAQCEDTETQRATLQRRLNSVQAELQAKTDEADALRVTISAAGDGQLWENVELR